jgi:Xaa-Pro aminopeptidase
MCPIDTNMVNVDLLNRNQIQWLNQYHEEVRTILTPALKDPKVLAWLFRKTKPVVHNSSSSSSSSSSSKRSKTGNEQNFAM